MDALSFSKPFQAEPPRVTISERLPPTRLATGSVFFTPSKVDALETETECLILPHNPLPPKVAQHLAILAQTNLALTPSITIWIILLSKSIKHHCKAEFVLIMRIVHAILDSLLVR